MIGRGIKPTEGETKEEIKGFDSFETSLGDVMRGERATLGKSLLDVQRELKIKAAYIASIENADPTAFDTPGFIAGYVRSYARYLNLDPDWAFDTFCAESGFTTAHGMSAAASTVRPAREDRLSSSNDGDIFAAPTTPYLPAGEAIMSGVEPRAIGSVLVLVALLGGIGYGGWTVLQEVQRVQLAPVEQPPTVIADVDPLAGNAAPETPAGPGEEFAAFTPPSAEALDRLYRPQALDVPILVSRDGPIATLDPLQGGALIDSGDPRLAARETPEQNIRPEFAPPGTFPLGLGAIADAAPFIPSDPADVMVVEAEPDNVTIVAVDETWVRVTSSDGTHIFEAVMQAGDTYEVPLTEQPPTLRTGNSGGVYFAMGADHYGPVGPRGQVTSNVALSVDDVSAGYTVADLTDHSALCTVVVASLETPDLTCP